MLFGHGDDSFPRSFNSLEDLVKHSENLAKRADMAKTELQKSIYRLLDELSDEHLYTFYRLLNLMLASEEVVPIMLGQAEALLRVVRKRCLECGEPAHDLHP